ncbi:MAG: 3'(2'),5'-bisphosphate nucleotidase CysQ [Chloroflexia bacterium]|nr:3'(2'),5'-bisphosphate nucleotidase CysQ [Chloroflexia bacterium]
MQLKSDESPVTKADRRSSEVISQYLIDTHYPIIDEEICFPEYNIRKTWNKYWLVDPLDGTREFISGNGEFTVNIALISGDSPVFGVIYAPVTGIIYWGGKDTGSFRLENIEEDFLLENIKKAVPISCDMEDSKVLRVAASRSHMDESTSQYIQILKNRYENIDFISRGSSLKLCMIASGEVDVYPRFSRTMEWDTAAAQIIVEEAGGQVVDFTSGKKMQYNKENLLNPYFVVYDQYHTPKD